MNDNLEILNQHLNIRQTVSRGSVTEARMLLNAIERSEKLLKPRLQKIGLQRRDIDRKPDYKIGFISRRLGFSTDESPSDLEVFSPSLSLYGSPMEPYYQIVKPVSLERSRSAQVAILAAITGLAESGANIIGMNELAYPAFKFVPGDDVSEADRLMFISEDAIFRNKIQQIVDKYKILIVCGSYHDVYELNNKAVIFAPQAPTCLEHEKLTSAKATSEVIRTPRGPEFIIYDTFLGRVAILICLDAFDLNIFCRFALMGSVAATDKPIDMIVVPAWSSAPLTKACKDLSYFARCLVVYINGAAEPHEAIFMAGVQIHIGRDVGNSIVDIDAEARWAAIEKASQMQELGIFAGVRGTIVANS